MNDSEALLDEIERAAMRIRRDVVAMIGLAGSGHPGGSLSAADIVAALYFGVMRHNPSYPSDPTRDRFVLSKGHAAPVLYAALAQAGYFSSEHLLTLRKLGSLLQGHPDSTKTPGVEISTGSLGQGLSVACGMALGLRRARPTPVVYCLLGDGECQEGQVWEAAMFAAHHSLGNLVAIVDHNGLQIDGACSEVMCLGSLPEKFRAFGWHVEECDGHDVPALVGALRRAVGDTRGVPCVVVARTLKGKGVSFMEGVAEWHGMAPSEAETTRALAELAVDDREGGIAG